VKHNLKAVILAGGFATRLRPLSCTRPKILFPILNKPLLQWTYERLAKHKIDEAVLAVNYQTEVAIKQHKTPKNGLKIKYSHDPPTKPLGSGGPIKKAEKLIGHNKPFLALNGDIFVDVDYSAILENHQEGKAVATIALTRVEDPSRYGVAELAKDGRITRFIEKPTKEKAPTNLINAGVYVLSPRILDYIPAGRTVSIEYDVFTKLATEGKLYGYVHHGLWFDIGKPEDYLRIHRTLLDSLNIPQEPKTNVKNPVAFDKGVSVGKKSIIGPYAVLGRNVKVGDSANIQDSVILPGTVICDHASINGAIIGENVIIGNRVKISRSCILGDHVRIKDNVMLAEEVSVCPAKEISESVLTPQNIC
jgi:mannose-1-phosphate guanylyltransferase